MSSLWRKEYTAIVDRRAYPSEKWLGNFSLIEVSVTPGSLFQQRNYGLDRWKIASNSGLREGQLWNRAYGIDTQAYLYMCNVCIRGANARDACNRIKCGCDVSLSLSNASRGFSKPKRVGTCPKYRDTCQSLLKIDSSLCAIQCISYVHFSARKNSRNTAIRSEGLRLSHSRFAAFLVKISSKMCGSQQC